jgi:hypothetical protein
MTTLPPAGSLMIMLDEFKQLFGVTDECIHLLSSCVPLPLTSELLERFADDEDDVSDETVTTTAQVRMVIDDLSLIEGSLWAQLSGSDVDTLVASSSVVQCMQLVNDFCDAFGVGAVGEKELKFGIPADAMIRAVYELARDVNFKQGQMSRDFFIVSRCRRIRHERKIDLNTNTMMSLVPIDRTSVLESPVVPSFTPPPLELQPFPPSYTPVTFQLHKKSVLRHSGPSLVFALSFFALEKIVKDWVDVNRLDYGKWIHESPFDCVVRALRAAEGNPNTAEKFLCENIATDNRYRFRSFGDVRDRIEAQPLPANVNDVLTNKISATYCYLVVYNQIDKRDNKWLAEGWITVDELDMFSDRPTKWKKCDQPKYQPNKKTWKNSDWWSKKNKAGKTQLRRRRSSSRSLSPISVRSMRDDAQKHHTGESTPSTALSTSIDI